MRAEIAGQAISKFISKDWPSDKKEIYEILTLAVNKAWKEGKWFGMTKEIYVPIQYSNGEYFIIAPQEFPILLAINVDGKPNVDIRSKHFIFHRDGNGDIKDRKGCKWVRDVFDMGEIPVLDDTRINGNSPVRIGVRAIGVPGEDEKIYIKGKYSDGQSVFTYKNKEYGEPCECKVESEQIETVTGVELPVTKDFNYICNISFTDITHIEKTFTRTPVEIIALDKDNKGFVISKMNPGQRKSRYRKYLVPKPICGYKCVHGLFKISKQEEIISDSDEVIIDDTEALIALAKSIDYIYYKGQVDLGSAFYLQAISLLDKEKREEESPEVFPIQVEILNHQQDILNYL